MRANAMRIEEVITGDIQPGDAVTPTNGVFRGMRFAVLEVRPVVLGVEVLIRPYETGPVPLWVPRDDVAPMFDATRCQVCGSDRHPRCRGV